MAHQRKSIPLNPLRTFSIAYRHTTFSAAARELGVSPVAISRQITILENYLGAQLFERHAKSVRLTALGHSLGEQIAQSFDHIEISTLNLLSSEREHVINVRAYPTFAYHWLLPRLGMFKSVHPDVDVRLDTSLSPLEFRDSHLEVAILLGTGDWRDVRGRELFTEEVDVVCSREYSEQFNNFKDPNVIENATLMHARNRRDLWAQWSKHSGLGIEDSRGYEFETSLMAYRAAANGLGLAIGELRLIDDEMLQSDELICPFNKVFDTGQSFWIVWPTSTSVSTITKRLIDWLLECANQPPEFYK